MEYTFQIPDIGLSSLIPGRFFTVVTDITKEFPIGSFFLTVEGHPELELSVTVVQGIPVDNPELQEVTFLINSRMFCMNAVRPSKSKASK